ncbi:MAG: cytochrome-c peroxidase [Gammaproteobacteria bacterium]
MISSTAWRVTILALSLAALSGCGSNDDDAADIARKLGGDLDILLSAAGPGADSFALPNETALSDIPSDPANPLTAEKVALGQMLYHETGLATQATDINRTGTYSCATCHHSSAGFKAGVPQGISDGGEGFGLVGEGRLLGPGMDASAPANSPHKPDIQPVASPTTLNVAYQEVMLWNGQFGNASNSSINSGIPNAILATPNTPKAENNRGLSGVEIQAVAGLGVHRLSVEGDSLLQNQPDYMNLFAAAFPASTDTLEDAAKAIAAYERTLLTNRAPFQRWLQGDREAMNEEELRGALLFFGKANCVECHNGPALSSAPGATADAVFMALGFADLDTTDPRVHGTVGDADSRGRGGFTGNPQDDYKFKIPSLYNLADAGFYGHGASFNSVRDVVAYKNAGVPQKAITSEQLDSRFQPLGLSDTEIDNLTTFLETALYDAELDRYVPDALPTGNCFPNADTSSIDDLGC